MELTKPLPAGYIYEMLTKPFKSGRTNPNPNLLSLDDPP